MGFQLPQLPPLGPRMRRLVRIAGYVMLALVSFVFALQLTFPYDRVKDRIEEKLSEKYDVTIGGVERGIMPGRMYLKYVTLQSRPKADAPTAIDVPLPHGSDSFDSGGSGGSGGSAAVETKPAPPVPTKLFIQRLEIDVGLFALLAGKASIDVEAEIGSGTIAGNVTIAKDGTEVELEGSAIPSERLPMQDWVGLPLTGKVNFEFDLDLPNEKSKTGRVGADWSKASGSIAFDCPSSCTVGPGRIKPKAKSSRDQAFVGDGLDIGKIFIDRVTMRGTIKSSKLELTKFEAPSKDGELHLDFAMTLSPSFDESMVSGCLRFKASEELAKREPKTAAQLTTTGAKIGPDKLFHIKLDGPFKNMKRLAQFCGPSVRSVNMDNPSGGSANTRPNLTIQPEEAVKPAVPIPPPAADAAVPVPVPGPVDEHPHPPGTSPTGSPGSGSAGSAVPPSTGGVTVPPPGSGGSAEGAPPPAPAPQPE